MKILFAGTPEFAAKHLQSLIDSKHQLCAVYTQPDRPAGRGKKIQASAVKQLALAHDIPLEQPPSLKSPEQQRALANYDADIMVVVAYGLLLPQAVLDAPRRGCINVHGSILPRWRGAAPIQRAIEAGDHESGVTIMQMDAGLDTGDMLLKERCVISSDDTSKSLHDKLCHVGPTALLEALEGIEKQTVQPEKQDDSASSYARKIEKSEANLDWCQDAQVLDRKIRAFQPFPVCYSELNGQRVKIHYARVGDFELDKPPGTLIANARGTALSVACGPNGQQAPKALLIDTLQTPGKKPMSARDYLNGLGIKAHADPMAWGEIIGQFTTSNTR